MSLSCPLPPAYKAGVPEPATVWTIGHSTRSFDAFLALLAEHHIGALVDVRTVPRSRRHPHFSKGAVEAGLREAGVDYEHAPGLGGLRKPQADSRNAGWRHESFRGYADHMQGDLFRDAMDRLEGGAVRVATAVMCAEAVWWQCHRQLIADALVARGHEVRHILGPGQWQVHRLTSFARVRAGRVDYPGLLD